jgi:hypothetical protein
MIALGASLVCRVLNTMCPVSAAWTAISAVLQVADFADHDDVRDPGASAREGLR